MKTKTAVLMLIAAGIAGVFAYKWSQHAFPSDLPVARDINTVEVNIPSMIKSDGKVPDALPASVQTIMAKKIWSYFDTRDDAQAQLLLADILKSTSACAYVRDTLRKGRDYSLKDTKLQRVNVTARDCDYQSTYLFKGPDKYDPQKKYPLLIVIHGGGGSTRDNMQFCEKTAGNYIKPWLSYADKNGIFIAAPVCDKNWAMVG